MHRDFSSLGVVCNYTLHPSGVAIRSFQKIEIDKVKRGCLASDRKK